MTKGFLLPFFYVFFVKTPEKQGLVSHAAFNNSNSFGCHTCVFLYAYTYLVLEIIYITHWKLYISHTDILADTPPPPYIW